MYIFCLLVNSGNTTLCYTHYYCIPIFSFSTKRTLAHGIVGYIGFVLAILFLLKEIAQMFLSKLKYFLSPNNYLELLLYITTIIFMVQFVRAEIDGSNEVRVFGILVEKRKRDFLNPPSPPFC